MNCLYRQLICTVIKLIKVVVGNWILTIRIVAWYLLSSPGPSPSPGPCPDRPPSWIKVLLKRKKEGFGPRADTIITWATTTHPQHLSMKECSGQKVLIVKLSQNDPLDSPTQKMTRWTWTARSRTWDSPTCLRRSLSNNPNFKREGSQVQPRLNKMVLLCLEAYNSSLEAGIVTCRDIFGFLSFHLSPRA